MLGTILEDGGLATESSSDCGSFVPVTQGVIFSKSVRAHFCSLHVARLRGEDDCEDDWEHSIFSIQFEDREMRSFCRRYLKLGDLIGVAKGQTTDDERLIVDISSVEQAESCIRVLQPRYWSIQQYQQWQKEYLPPSEKQSSAQCATVGDKHNENTQNNPHPAGGLEKRQQGEYIANFLVNMLFAPPIDPTEWPTLDSTPHNERAAQRLNQGAGVLDAAGGSGHVSMALGIRGIQSTVVDPRQSVGKLPGRDRKIWNRALRNTCQPVQEYRTLRAWLGEPPPQVRTANQENLPKCALVESASAIVALHPDEATEAVVDIGLEQNIPFIVVPCCVFGRFFPHRKINNTPVSTRAEFIDYLRAKNKDIRQTTLPFVGANVALWYVPSES